MQKIFLNTVVLLFTLQCVAQNGISINSQWIISHFYFKDSIVYAAEKDSYITITDSVFDGKVGCRNFNGKLKNGKESFKIKSFNLDNVFCKKNKQSSIFIANLLKANLYSINAAELTLYYNNKKLMVLESWR